MTSLLVPSTALRVSTISIDSGCSCVVVSEEALPLVDVNQCPKVRVSDYLGRVDSFSLVRCYLRCQYFDGWVNAVRFPVQCCSVLLSNIKGVRDLVTPVTQQLAKPTPPPEIATASSTSSSTWTDINIAAIVQAVQTTSSSTCTLYPLILPALQPLYVTPNEFSKLQKSCCSLHPLHPKAGKAKEEVTRRGAKYNYQVSNSLLYRVCSFITKMI